MKLSEALNLFTNTRQIVVASKNGIEYFLEQDVVECSFDGFVYGFPVNSKKGKSQNIRWFNLQNATFVRTV